MEETKNNKKSSVLAIVGLVLAIIGVLLSAVPIINNFAFLLAILGLIFGIVGIVQTKKGKRKGRGLAIAAVILSIICFAVVLVSQQIYGSVLDKASESINESVNKSSGKATNELLKTDVNVKIGQFEATKDEFGINSTKLPVSVTNKNSATMSYSIKIEAVDGAGSRVGEDTVYVDKLGAGQSQTFEAFKYVESTKVETLKTATFKTVSVSQY